MSKASIYNKVNLITIMRIILTVIGILLIFSDDIKLLLIAYAIMGFSEVTDVIDGYVARRDKLVTDLGKILDPLSDSISRFFYFFALAYHGLFPIWYMIFFFFRDIVVAYVRIYASFSGTVMSARISGKLKGAVQFAGQFLLMMALLINKQNEGAVLTDKFVWASTMTAFAVYWIFVIYFKIKGKLLYLLLSLSIMLAAFLLILNKITFSINYFTTYTIAAVTIGVTLYSLVDYLMSLNKQTKKYQIGIVTSLMILFMIAISPYFLDLLKNKVEGNPKELSWEKLSVIENSGKNINGITGKNELLIVSHTDINNNSGLTVYSKINSNYKLLKNITIGHEHGIIKDMAVSEKFLYLIDDEDDAIIKADLQKSIDSGKLITDEVIRTGFTSSATLSLADLNGDKFLIMNDYFFSGYLYFFALDKIDPDKNLKMQVEFKVKSELYVKAICVENNKLYLLVNKVFKDLIYETDLKKLAYTSSVSKAIENIYSTSEWNFKGINSFSGRLFSYSANSKTIYRTIPDGK